MRRKRPIHAGATDLPVPGGDSAPPPSSPSESEPAPAPAPSPTQSQQESEASEQPTPVKKIVRKKKIVSQPEQVMFAPIGGVTPGMAPKTEQRPTGGGLPSGLGDTGLDVCSDIPLIDLGGDTSMSPSPSVIPSSSSGSLSSKAGPKRKKVDASLSFFDGPDAGDDRDDGIIDDNYDLSRVKELEARTLLNRGASENNREVFMRKMNERMEEHKRTYVRPTQKADLEIVDRVFLDKELAGVLKITAESVRARAENYEPGKCDFSGIEKKPPTFSPDVAMLSKLAGVTQDATLTMPEILRALDAEYLRPGEWPKEEHVDTVATVNMLFAASSKQLTATDFVVDFSTPDACKMLTELGSFLLRGVKGSLVATLDKLALKMTEDSRERPNIVSLQSSVMRAKGDSKEKSQLRYAASYCFALLKDSHLSFFLRYLADAVSFKKEHYYSDAEIQGYEVCMGMAAVVEKIECMELHGEPKMANIPKFAKPISLARMTSRISDVVGQYIRQTSTWMIQGVEIARQQLGTVTEIMKLFFMSILRLENGESASPESLWDLYDALASGECQHKLFPKYLELHKEVKKRTLLTSTKRGILMTYFLLKENLLPFLFVFLSQFARRTQISNPCYWKIDPKATCSTACLRLAMAFLPLRSVRTDVKEEDFCKRIKEVLD